MTEPIRTPISPPLDGALTQVMDGVFWTRMPFPGPLAHVNCYVFDDGDDGWTVVDTGIDSRKTRALWTALIDGPLKGRPIHRVIATHHHLDHFGLAGWFVRSHGAQLVTTRTAYLMARMLCLDVQDRPTPEMLQFWRAAGMAEEVFAERENARPFNTADAVSDIPLGYTRICDGDTIEIGGQIWDIRCGEGHAPEHATFWRRDDALVIGGDQLLASISPNLGVTPTEPNADPVGAWMDSCRRLASFAKESQLVLTGHKNVFTGLPARLAQLIENHESGLERLLEALDTPRTACDCFDVLFKRQISGFEYGLAMVEAMAHCNHLFAKGLVSRVVTDDGAYLWQRIHA